MFVHKYFVACQLVWCQSVLLSLVVLKKTAPLCNVDAVSSFEHTMTCIIVCQSTFAFDVLIVNYCCVTKRCTVTYSLFKHYYSDVRTPSPCRPYRRLTVRPYVYVRVTHSARERRSAGSLEHMQCTASAQHDVFSLVDTCSDSRLSKLRSTRSTRPAQEQTCSLEQELLHVVALRCAS